MTYRFAWQSLIVTVLALSASACLMDDDKVQDVRYIDDASGETPGVTVAITKPGTAQVDTEDTDIDIAGTASADVAIASIAWENDLGGSGMAAGTAAWQATGIPLKLGKNTITVSATTADGDSTVDQVVVNRESVGKKSVTISWNAPSQRTNGAPLKDLAGYRIYYGRMSETYDYEVEIKNPGVVTYVIEDLVPGKWYFVATAIDSAGVESAFSNEVVRSIL